MVWAHRASGGENPAPWQGDVEQVAVIEELAGNPWEDRDEGDWDLSRADRLEPEVGRDEQQFLFCRVSEMGRQIRVTVCSDVRSLLKLVEQWFRTHAM